MTDNERMPWVQTTAGIVTVNGVIAAVVGSAVTWVINNAANLPWVAIISVFVVVAVAFFLGLSIVVPRLRNAIWRRPLRFLWSLRPVSARRFEREAEIATHFRSSERKRVQRDMDDLDARIRKLEEKRPTGRTFTPMDPEWSTIERLMSGRNGGGKVALETPPSEKPVPPLPRPRWSLHSANRPDVENRYMLANVVPRSVAREVRIEADADMQIVDAGHWGDLSPKGDDTEAVGFFTGIPNHRGIRDGVWVTITWYDENGKQAEEQKQLWPPRPAEFDERPSDDSPF